MGVGFIGRSEALFVLLGPAHANPLAGYRSASLPRSGPADPQEAHSPRSVCRTQTLLSGSRSLKQHPTRMALLSVLL